MILITCKVDGCDNEVKSKGYCNKHELKYRKYGDPLAGKTYEKHGMKNTLIYAVWQRMLRRCDNKAFHAYHRYGGRGITVCDRWKNSFMAFYEDMGDKPFPEAQIDRINNDGNYELGNCRWVTPATNSRGRSTTKLSIDKAREIRSLYRDGYSHSELGDKYKVTAENIKAIIDKDTWKEDFVISCDPGVSKPSCFAIHDKDKLVEVAKTNDIKKILPLLDKCNKLIIEDFFLGNNPKTLKDLAKQSGKIIGMAEYLGLEVVNVMPITWQSYFKIPRKPKGTSPYHWKKQHALDLIEKAEEATGWQFTGDDDTASAVLLGLYFLSKDKSVV